MNKKKLKLESLKVMSFVTMSSDEADKVKAGIWDDSYYTECDYSCLVECTDGYYSDQLPCRTEQCQGGTATCANCYTASEDMEVCEC